MSDPTTKPYLLRALYEWCVDQGYTPYIAVMVDRHTIVPASYVRDGQIVLNIGPDACHQLDMGNELITFQARFNGVAQGLSVPVANVAAIYARENGQGMGFEVELAPEDAGEAVPAEAPQALASEHAPDAGDAEQADKPRPAGRAHLKLIK